VHSQQELVLRWPCVPVLLQVGRLVIQQVSGMLLCVGASQDVGFGLLDAKVIRCNQYCATAAIRCNQYCATAAIRTASRMHY